jgi:septal ring-binding cell division protein DamX
MVLESRHLIGIFLLMVVISGVVFTLGYVLGRSQDYTQVRAASGTKAPAPSEPAPAKTVGPSAASQPNAPAGLPAPSDWDLYRAPEPKKADELQKPVKPVAVRSKPTAPAQPSSPPVTIKAKKTQMNGPLVPRGALLLQVAAMTREDDALALAESLQRKKFPAFVQTPGADHYYRVQVGPYANARAVVIARRGLEHEGFKAIVRH